MENNTDIIVLTSVIIVLFIVFIIATLREFNTIGKAKFQEEEEGGPRAEMLRFIGKLFTDERIDTGKKIAFMNAVKPIIEDLVPEEEKKKE
ncbi:hypothetical protein [Ferruginibacter sp.]|uniref:hypothetical protein n=1 Tax=Ferruginibacter sp. TaxID=1940288 RepID=UPI00265B10DE|nr:hypothetical protein [Ferruginibacter sp.]